MKLNSIQKKIILKNRLTFLFVLLFVYILLFEFILPVNKILPKPSLLLDSIPALFSEYNLLYEMAITTSIIYLAIAIGFLFVWMLSFYFATIVNRNIGIFNNLRLFKNFPAFFFAILFAFWFEGSVFAELLFTVIVSTFFISISFMNSAITLPTEYKDAAKSLMIEEMKFHNNITWKYSLPKMFDELHKLHYYLWVLVLIFEFVSALNGFGSIYKLALNYNDLSVIILLGIIIALLIWLGNSIIDYIEKKLIFWKA